jgi:hypothetical protein
MEAIKKGYRFTTDIPSLHRVRMLGIYISTAQVACIVEKSTRWVRLNRDKFLVDDSNRNLKYELSTVLEYYFIQHLNEQ